jgi:5-methylcytosine-specific restriction enzyme subunit McrC
MPLLEVFINDFLNEVLQLVKRGIRFDYVRQTDNLPFLKGKLHMAGNLKYNLIRRDRFYVEYDNYEANRPENRLIKSSLLKAFKLCKHFINQRLTRELLFVFDEIPASPNIKLDFQRCGKDREMHYYQSTLDWCRIILNDESPVPQSGNRSFRTYLFPMPLLFERYVARVLARKFPDWQIQTQARSESLLSKTNEPNKVMFQIRPDILLKKGEYTIIADTKWKMLNTTDIANKYGVAQGDLYQLFTYSKYYKAKHLVLIYPKTDNFKEKLSFEFKEDIEHKCNMHLCPFDFDEDKILGLDEVVH